MLPTLFVGNQNYSSWSLRPWLALRWGGIDHELRVIPLGGVGYTERRMPEVLAVSPSGTVPSLRLGDDTIWDSLAICEWAAERKAMLWPSDPTARAYARAATCEMHSGFSAIRSKLACNIRRRAEPRVLGDDVRREIARVETLWSTLAQRFSGGGPYLFGERPTIADAFFTPMATRFRSYAVPLAPETQRYADALLADPTFRVWEEAAEREPMTMPIWDAL